MKGLLKFITCGSVDDGKSTLIGHILYDSKLLYADQKEALILDSKVGSRGGEIDYSLLLDGLMAEREQGITIDVAYRYFTTDKRSFIVADTPGHEEYTRNMAVGASFAELAVILVDASQGVQTQTRRHARICKLMGIEHYIFAINKMDLVGYDEGAFNKIADVLSELAGELGLGDYVIIPVSATEGDNVTVKSETMTWYKGKTILDHLETVDTDRTDTEEGFYLPVQRVCRPNYNFRGFQGQIEAGSVRRGDKVSILPSGEEANVKSILIGDREADEASVGQAVTVTLDKEVDISRGCVISKDTSLALASEIEVNILWMNDEKLDKGRFFLVKIGTRLIPGTVSEIKYLIDINSGEKRKADSLQKNELAVCKVKLADVIVADKFVNHKTLGELILIDRITNMTSACGVITNIETSDKDVISRVTGEVRAQMNMQQALIFEFRLGHGEGFEGEVSSETIHKVEKELVIRQRHTYMYHPGKGEPVAEVLRHLQRAGIVVLFARDEGIDLTGIEKVVPEGTYISDWQNEAGGTVSDISEYIYRKTVVSKEYGEGEAI